MVCIILGGAVDLNLGDGETLPIHNIVGVGGEPASMERFIKSLSWPQACSGDIHRLI